jgi:hypothetical protein
LAIRDTPEHYFQTRTRAEVTAPPQQPLPVQQYTQSQPIFQLPEINTTGLIVIGIVAVVGLLGLYALLSSKK